MKILDPLRHLFTYRARGRYVLLMATRQDHNALALFMIMKGGTISYEVYNSAHASREPVPFERYSQALRYVFPRSIDAAQTEEQRLLRIEAKMNAGRELLRRGRPGNALAAEQQRDEQLKSAIIALGDVGADRASALAMEIHRGMERDRHRRP
jgi:hypothetical protein